MILSGVMILGLCQIANGQSNINTTSDFEKDPPKYQKIGRGETKIENGVLKTKEAYAAIGEDGWTDYEVSFRARTSEKENQVQIWAGFRASGRSDRYILGLRGGIQNDLYLARLGYMGTDDHLALRHLDFPLVVGKWYDIKVQVAGNRIRVFLNNEAQPRIDVKDKFSGFSPKGKVILGGSWIANEFDDHSIRSLDKAAFGNNLAVAEYAIAKVNKNKKREQERAAYKSVGIKYTGSGRTQISLNGNWLFKPDYEVKDESELLLPNTDDSKWHVMSVPNFWNRNREWLHGERYNTESKGVADNYFQKEIERCESYTFDYKKTAIGYYRHWIELPANIKDKNLELSFDAVSKVADVYVNGKKLANHIGMFGEFKVDASKELKPGKNLIVVKVTRDYVKDIKDADKVTDVAVTVPVTNKMLKDLAHGFYGFDPAGIWQPVSLIISDKLRVTDVFIKPTLEGAAFDVKVKNNAAEKKVFSLKTAINGQGFKEELYNRESLKTVALNPGEEKTLTYHISGLKPKLWTPATPNLYNFIFTLADGKGELDRKEISSGFRTFEVKGVFFYLNGKQYWLRGGNHTPMSLAPNDTLLANKFSELMRQGNIAITRTHTAPYSETWMTASDKYGIGVSYEGQWPWLMIKESMPDQNLIDLWKDEYIDLIKKYRNHPSLLLWTVNNEMKFYDNDSDFERAKLKMKIISDLVKRMREVDPTRPVVFDSNYRRNERKFGKDFFKDIDDGDIDDQHWYVNWYHGSVFSEFNGQWQKLFKNEGRPLISQEFSTGYPSETGHPTRFYTYVHQNPAAMVGNYAYEYADPKYFLQTQSFITRESAEAVRRTNEKGAGVLHFAALTWFKNVYQHDKLATHVTYDLMKKALQPVLVSAELWGRSFYAGEKLPARIFVVNDSEDARALAKTELVWSIQQEKTVLATGKELIEGIPYYGRKWIEPNIQIPAKLATNRIDAKLVLKLLEGGKVVSENDYDITIANKPWLNTDALKGKKVALVNANQKIAQVLDYQGLKYISSATFEEAIKSKPDVIVYTDLSQQNTEALRSQITNYVKQGGKLLLLDADKAAASLFPRHIRGAVQENGEIINLEIPESPVFNGIEPMDIRYFNNNKREIPLVSKAFYQVNISPEIEALAVFTKIHGYLNGEIDERKKTLDGWRGYPIVKIKDSKGSAILSEVLLDKGNTDPIAGKLLVNMLIDLLK